MEVKYKYSGGSKSPFNKFFRSKFFGIFILSSVFFMAIGPLIADQIVNNGGTTSGSESITAGGELAPVPVPLPIPVDPAQSDSASNETSTATSEGSAPSPLPTPTKAPPHAVANQNMLLQLPRSVRVDPRSKMVNLPQVNFSAYGSPYLMLCINVSKGIIDLEAKGVDDTFIGKSVFINNDRSPAAQISGTSSQVLNIVNSFQGLRVASFDGKGIAGSNLLFRFVAISEPTNNFALCSESKSYSQWTIEILALGLQVNTKKNSLGLGDKK